MHQISIDDLLSESEKTFNKASTDNPLREYVSNGEISVPEDQFYDIKKQYSSEQIIQFLTEEILAGAIKLPLRDYSESDAIESFEKLCDYSVEIKSGETFTRYDYKYSSNGTYIDCSTVGNVASDFFHQRSRYEADSLVSPSPARTWSSEKFLHSALGALFTMNMKEITTTTLRTCLCLRKYTASQFKPAVAKTIFDTYGPESVLDFCSGWGDRMCGFYASKKPRRYVGIDPNTKLREGYRRQIETYSSLVCEKKDANIITAPAEDVLLLDNMFDMVFTSPPYFNIEKYCEEETQSYKRYRNIDAWLNNFLFKAIKNAWDALRKGGYMLINISDVYSGHQVQNICDPMNDFIARLGGTYHGYTGMKMSKRPNSKASASGIFVEPIWVWQKTC